MIWERKMDAYRDLLTLMEQNIDELKSASSHPQRDANRRGGGAAFATFASTIESPVDWSRTQVVYADQAFDSLTVDARYVSAMNSAQSGSEASYVDRIASVVAQQNRNATVYETSMATSAAHTIAARAQLAFDATNLEGTVVLTAFATHRRVKTLQPLVVSADKLWNAWNYYYPGDKITDPVLQREDFARTLNDLVIKDNGAAGNRVTNQTTINLVTEMFLGSTFIGMVHFTQRNSTALASTQSGDASMRNGSSSSVDNVIVDALKVLAGRTGSVQAVTGVAKDAAQRASKAGFHVAFDMVCVGFVPHMSSRELQRGVQQFKGFDPSTFTVPRATPPALPSDVLTPAYVQTVQQSNMQAVISATVDALSNVDESRVVLDERSFMNAFAEFVAHAQGDSPNSFGVPPGRGTGPSVGAPVGLNVKRYSKMDVMSHLARRYFGTSELGSSFLTTDQSAAMKSR